MSRWVACLTPGSQYCRPERYKLYCTTVLSLNFNVLSRALPRKAKHMARIHRSLCSFKFQLFACGHSLPCSLITSCFYRGDISDHTATLTLHPFYTAPEWHLKWQMHPLISRSRPCLNTAMCRQVSCRTGVSLQEHQTAKAMAARRVVRGVIFGRKVVFVHSNLPTGM